MKKLIFAIALALITAGCAGKSAVESTINSTDIVTSEYAYVLIGAQGGSTSWLHSSKFFNQMNSPLELITVSGNINGMASYALYKVKAGKYTMVDFSDNGYSMTREGKVANENHKLEGGYFVASFVAEPGRITYVGTVRGYISNAIYEYTLAVKMDREAAMAYLKANYPELNYSNLYVESPVQVAPAFRER